jgi:hypothetical protein
MNSASWFHISLTVQRANGLQYCTWPEHLVKDRLTTPAHLHCHFWKQAGPVEISIPRRTTN